MKQNTKKLLALLLGCAMLIAVLAGCGGTKAEEPAPAEEAPALAEDAGDTASLVDSFMETADEPKEVEEIEYDPDGAVVPGTYVFDDYKADMDFSIMWNFTLNEDGSYTLSEDNPFIGVQEYAGQTSETDGNRVDCGPMDPDKSTTEGDWAYPTGFSVLVNADNMTFQPESISDEVFGREENEGGEPSGEPAEDGAADEAAEAAVYVYDDYKEMVDAHILWTLTIREDGSFTLTEDNPFGGLSEYAGEEAVIEDDQIVCGPMDPAPGAGDWAFPDGFTVSITGEGTFEPTVFERFGDAGPSEEPAD